MFRVIATTPDRQIHEIDDFKAEDWLGAIASFLKQLWVEGKRSSGHDGTLPVGWTVTVTHYDRDDRPPIFHTVHSSRY